MVQLAPGQSPNMTIDALYAFTDCEVSISPNACVIIDDKPVFLSVNKILEYNTLQTKDLLNQELGIRKSELLEKLLFSSLEKIFIENRIYREIEECETWEAVLETIDHGLEPFKPDFYREITKEDIIRLTEIKIKRISKFDTFKADELMRKLTEELNEVNHHLENLTDYAIQYYKDLLKKYGKGRERKTEARTFDTIAANIVAANNAKLYVNRADGFVGYGLKKDEFVCECSDLDDIIIFRRDGVCMVTKIQDKGFVGKDIIHVAVFRKGDERMVYNLIYLDGGSGRTMIKRFQVLSVTRDREYVLTKGTKGTKVLYFTANANGEAEIVTVYLTAGSKARVKVFDYDFKELEIKGRAAKGNILTKYPVRKIQLKMEGVSTLGGLDIYFDPSVGRLNTDERGNFVGNFLGEDKVLVFYKDGSYELTTFELTNRYEPENILLIEKYDPESVVSSIYYDGVHKMHYVKRFVIETSTLNKKFNFISDHKQSKLTVVSTEKQPQVKVKFKLDKEVEEKVYDMDMLIDVKGWKSVGNRLSNHKVMKISLVESAKPEKKKETTENDNGSDQSTDNSGEDDDKEQLGLF
jgi:topoisomerase-4 subunit A